MQTSSEYSPAGRIPKQSRGRVRREALIDAASDLVAQGGEEAVSLHEVARRTKTSVGSVYHLFSHRDQLLRAVAERHVEALANITDAMGEIPLSRWREMTPSEVISNLWGGPLRYFTQNPAALPVVDWQDPSLSNSFQRLLLDVMQARLGETQGKRLAAALYAVATGTLFFLHGPGSRGVLAATVEIEPILTIMIEKADSL